MDLDLGYNYSFHIFSLEFTTAYDQPPRRASRPSAGSIRRPSSGSRRGSAGSTASTREAPAQKIPPKQENTEESESSCKFSIDDQEEFSVISGQDQFGNQDIL